MLGWNDPRTILAVSQYAREAGWHLETRQFFTEVIPRDWSGEGLIVSNPLRPDVLKFVRKKAPQQATVLINGNRPGIHAPQVMEDNHEAGRLAARHFLDQGHKHFAWFGPVGGQVVIDRMKGFRAALNEAGFDCHLLKPTKKRLLSAQLRSLPQPLACYVVDDQLASDVIESCVSDGLRVPEDVAVMGTGNIVIACECSHVPISSIDLAEDEIGRQAAMLLDQLMQGEKPPADPIVIPPRGIVIRKSTDFLALTHPILLKAVDFITGNLEISPSLEQVATAADVSRRTLYDLFKRHLHQTPAEYIDREGFARARKLLATEKMTVAEAARRCGFGSARTLSRQFLVREGVNAQAWKKLQQSSR